MARANEQHVRCAVLTPLGRGAIATVAVRGPQAMPFVEQCFQPASGHPLRSFPAGRVVFGRFFASATATEELVVGIVGADEIEIHCHGGAAAALAVVAALVAAGAERVGWQRWVQGTQSDPIASEALIALAAARTERAAAVLLDQYRGALRNEIHRLSSTVELRAWEYARAGLAALAGRVELGLHLTQPWNVVLVGQPNAGKSSLINALLGYQRAIVFAEPGTTRDVLTATTAIDGWPVELSDTAGLRETAGAIEAEGVRRARRQIENSDLAILVLDTTAPWDASLLGDVSAAPRRLVVHNKCDLATPPADGRPAGIEVSALTGQRIDALLEAVATALVPHPPPAGIAVPFTPCQADALEQAGVELAKGNSKQTVMALDQMVSAK